MTKIEAGKTYLQNNGDKVRIVAIDLKNEKSVLGAVLTKDGFEVPRTYYPDGKWDQLRGGNPWDIIIPPERKSRWVNRYSYTGYETRELADCMSENSRTYLLEIITNDGKPVDVKIHEVGK